MEQFSLEKYLENPSRKVVTRDGRPVRILDYNLKGNKMICIAVDDETQESITTVDEDGHCLRDKTGWHESNFDLFFADEKEESQSILTMSKIAEQKALEAYPMVVSEQTISCRLSYSEGYDRAMQDFLKKAEGFLTGRVVLCFRVSWTEQQTPFLDFNIKNIVEQFKNYMQDET